MADTMNDWARTTGDTLGRSTQEIQKATNAFGIFFNQAAPTRQAAAEMSKQFAVLAQDLSSFFNVDPETALEKLRSGLSGEAEPLRDFGVFLNDAAVGQKALELGLAKTTKGLTDQQKIMARAALIMEATTNAQGDVIRTADGTANRIRAAAAAFEEMQVAIGSKLLPAMAPLIQRITELLESFNKLSPGLQKAIVYIGGFAAAVGPVLYVLGSLTKIIAPTIAGITTLSRIAVAATASTGSLAVGLEVLAVGFGSVLASIAPVVLAIGAVVAILYVLYRASQNNEKASAEYAAQQEKLRKIQEKVTDATHALATATGQARAEALANAKALRQETQQYLASARAALIAAKAKAQELRVKAQEEVQVARNVGGPLTRDEFGGTGIAIPGPQQEASRQAQVNLRAAEKSVKDATAELERLNKIINTPAPTASVPSVPSTTTDKGSKRSGPSAAEIEMRFQDELANYNQQILSAKSQQATSAQEQYDFELEGINIARERTKASIQADQDYSKAQKGILAAKVDELADQEIMAAEFSKRLRWEQEDAELAQTHFENSRDLLQLQYDVADTQAERKRIALEILALEQEYRRNQLELVIASKTATEAEKDRAQAILDSLDAIQAGERASVSRSNETAVEAYLRDLNKSPAQINEAIDQIKINGLEKLNDALVDAIVNFKSLADVAKSVVQSVLAELLRLQIQQAIIKPLASALGLAIPKFATGTSFAPGGLALVGERGPELVNLPRGSQVIPNRITQGMMGGRGTVNQSFYVTTPDANSFRRSERQITQDARRRLG